MENRPSPNLLSPSDSAPPSAKKSRKPGVGIVVAALVVATLVIGRMVAKNFGDEQQEQMPKPQTGGLATNTTPIAPPPPSVIAPPTNSAPTGINTPPTVVAVSPPAPQAPVPVPAPAPKPAPVPAPKPSKYKNGTYAAIGDYMTHAGPEEISISLTLNSDVITATTFTGYAAAGMSQVYMDVFASDYKPFVVGKNIDDVYLDNVSGSSLTPIGFNNALEKIKTQAAS